LPAEVLVEVGMEEVEALVVIGVLLLVSHLAEAQLLNLL
jgi:hypothetical protein